MDAHRRNMCVRSGRGGIFPLDFGNILLNVGLFIILVLTLNGYETIKVI